MSSETKRMKGFATFCLVASFFYKPLEMRQGCCAVEAAGGDAGRGSEGNHNCGASRAREEEERSTAVVADAAANRIVGFAYCRWKSL